jgi:hypothetical protein
MARDLVLGTLAVVVGALLCFRGYLTMRLVIPVWGAFTGFVLGAAAVGSVTGDGFLAGVASWAGGVVLGALFALIAYTYYELSVVLAMGAIGFALGTSVMVAVGVTWDWLIVTVAVLVGIALAVVALLADLPMLLLTLLTATAGATAVVAGTMLLVGALDADELTTTGAVERIQDEPGWWLFYAAVAVAGGVAQLRLLRSLRSGIRAQWEHEGGRQLRSN